MIFKKNYQLYTGCSQSFCFKTTTKVIIFSEKYYICLLLLVLLTNKYSKWDNWNELLPR